MIGQLELFPALSVQGPTKPRTNYGPVPRRLRLIPGYALGDRRAPARLDPAGRHGLEDGTAEVIVRGWGRPVTDVALTIVGVL